MMNKGTMHKLQYAIRKPSWNVKEGHWYDWLVKHQVPYKLARQEEVPHGNKFDQCVSKHVVEDH